MSVLVNKNTKVICQGFTGTHGTFHSEQAIKYGTKLVGGVTPKKEDKNILTCSLILFWRLKKNFSECNNDLCTSKFAGSAIIEAVEANIELIVCITEGIPD